MPCQSVETPRAMTKSAAPLSSQPRSFDPILPNRKEAESIEGKVPAPNASISRPPSMIEGAVVALTAIAMVIEHGIRPLIAPPIKPGNRGKTELVANRRDAEQVEAQQNDDDAGDDL